MADKLDAKTVARLKAAARRMGLAVLGPMLDQFRTCIREEREKGASEAEIAAKCQEVYAIVERDERGKVPDEVLNECLALIREAAMRTHDAPGTVQ